MQCLPLVIALLALIISSVATERSVEDFVTGPVPLIIDTDIGFSPDDTWAIALALNCPNVDIKLILTSSHYATGRAQIVAKFLTAVGYDDIPLGVGLDQDQYVGPLYGWAKDYDLNLYNGPLQVDGIAYAIQVIDKSPVPVTILEIAPSPNIQELLRQRPDLASKIIIYAMSGSINYCYGGEPGPCPEYNIVNDTAAAKVLYGTSWNTSMTIAPTDIGYNSSIEGPAYSRLIADVSVNTIVSTTIEMYNFWFANGGNSSWWGFNNPTNGTSVLWDVVALYLTLFEPTLVVIEPYHLIVTDSGMTVQNSTGQEVNVAIRWVGGADGVNDWQNLVVDILLSSSTQVPPNHLLITLSVVASILFVLLFLAIFIKCKEKVYRHESLDHHHHEEKRRLTMGRV